jgi:hypothetical protein
MDGKKDKELERAPRKLEDFLSPREPIPKGLYVILALSSFAFFLTLWSILTYGRFVDPCFFHLQEGSSRRVSISSWN